MEFFKDIGKKAKELFEDDYFYVKKVQVKSKNESEIEVVTEGELSAKGPQAALTLSRKAAPLSLEKFRVKSDGRVLAEASLTTSSYSKFTMCAEDGRQEPGKPLQSFGKLGCEILLPSPKLGVIGDVDVVNGPLCRLGVLWSVSKNFSLGVETLLNTHLEDKEQSPELVDMNIGMEYRGPDWLFSGRSYDSLSTLKLSYLHTLSSNIKIGTQIDYRLKGNSQKMLLAGEYKMDEKSTVKAKIDSSALISGSFRSKLSDFVALTICAEMDAQDWSADSHKFGIGLKFE